VLFSEGLRVHIREWIIDAVVIIEAGDVWAVRECLLPIHEYLRRQGGKEIGIGFSK
jgi:hypothetical protein